MMYWYGGGWSWWAVSLMWIGMLAFWGLVIWAVYALAVGSSHRDAGDSPDQARRILDERLARGEIDTDEYRNRLEALKSSNRTPTSVGGTR